jgi:hypothetical protein
VTGHQIWATAVVVWLIGLFMAWCLGYAARDRQHRAGHSSVVGQLARVRLELAAALDELDALDHDRLRCEAHRQPAPPPPAVVHVHVIPPLPAAPPHRMPLGISRVFAAMPVLPAEEVQS